MTAALRRNEDTDVYGGKTQEDANIHLQAKEKALYKTVLLPISSRLWVCKSRERKFLLYMFWGHWQTVRES